MPSKTPSPQSEKSRTVVLAFILYSLSLLLAASAVVLPALAPLAVVAGLGAVALSVLSLREL